MPLPPPARVHLRPVLAPDVPTLFDIQLDPEANRLAGTKPRDRDAFNALWARLLANPHATPPIAPDAAVIPKIIIADDELAGSISIFPLDGEDNIGYWLDRRHWGRGIATRAVALLLQQFPRRPITAHVVAHNTASIRALQRNGFATISREHCPATDRFVEGDVFTLKLG